MKTLFKKLRPLVFASFCLFYAAVARAQVTIYTNLPGQPSGSSGLGNFVDYLYRFAMMLAGILAFGAIVYGGIKYTLAAGNPTGQTEGKEWVKGALVGLLLLVGAYTILNIINPNLTNWNLLLPGVSVQVAAPTASGGSTSYQLCQVSAAGNMCVANYSSQADCQSNAGGTSNCYPGSCDPGSPCNNSSGNCAPLTSGDASQDNLNSSCFGGIGNGPYDASSIASKESGGDPTAPSTSDKCAEDNSVFSWGLFQINLTVNDVNGDGCPSAFNHAAQWDSTNHVYHCQVVNTSLYKKCVTDATKSSPNINAACPLAANSRAWDNWSVNCTCNFTPPSPHKLSC